MAIRLHEGLVLLVAGEVAASAACCCECDCALIDFQMIEGGGGPWSGSLCTECADTAVSQGFYGTTSWEFIATADGGCGWLDVISFNDSGYTAATGELPADYVCQDCSAPEFNPIDPVVRGSFKVGHPVTLYREEPGSCDEHFYPCFWIKPQSEEGPECCRGTESTPDANSCTSCCEIEIIASTEGCLPLDETGAGVAYGSASFTITVPDTGFDPNCDTIFEDAEAITWTLTIGANVYTGTGLTGEGEGDFSCECPDINPCVVTTEVTVEWCYGGVCCSSSITITS